MPKFSSSSPEPEKRQPSSETSLFAQLEHHFKPTENILAGADTFLRRYSHQSGNPKLMMKNPIDWVPAEIKSVRKMSRKQQITHLALIYSLIVTAQSDLHYREAIVELSKEKKTRTKITAQTHFADIAVGLMSLYGEDTPEDRKKYRGLYNRDSHAIRYLIAKNISPAKVEYLSSRKGEGPNAWSRRRAAAEKEGNNEIESSSGSAAKATDNEGQTKTPGKQRKEFHYSNTPEMDQIVEKMISIIKYIDNNSDVNNVDENNIYKIIQKIRQNFQILTEEIEQNVFGNDYVKYKILQIEAKDAEFNRILKLKDGDLENILIKTRINSDKWHRLTLI